MQLPGDLQRALQERQRLVEVPLRQGNPHRTAVALNPLLVGMHEAIGWRLQAANPKHRIPSQTVRLGSGSCHLWLCKASAKDKKGPREREHGPGRIRPRPGARPGLRRVVEDRTVGFLRAFTAAKQKGRKGGAGRTCLL